MGRARASSTGYYRRPLRIDAASENTPVGPKEGQRLGPSFYSFGDAGTEGIPFLCIGVPQISAQDSLVWREVVYDYGFLYPLGIYTQVAGQFAGRASALSPDATVFAKATEACLDLWVAVSGADDKLELALAEIMCETMADRPDLCLDFMLVDKAGLAVENLRDMGYVEVSPVSIPVVTTDDAL